MNANHLVLQKPQTWDHFSCIVLNQHKDYLTQGVKDEQYDNMYAAR